jgi:DNA polymerase I-like protein with 3'-5' exonuclease and polymerase domains
VALSFSRPKVNDKDIVKKSKSTKTRSSIKGGSNIATQIQAMSSMAEAKLSHHKDDYIIIRDIESFENYIEEAIKNKVCAIDTETTGLNPLTLDLVGVCLYTPTLKAAYIPINHKSYVTGARTSNQLTEADIKPYLEKFNNTPRCKWIMHNAKYDIRVVRHTIGIDLNCYWDTMLAGNCIDENESHRLKDLHLKYCDSTDTESLTFDKLFSGIVFDLVPISVAYLYAAGDAIKTYELYKHQENLFSSCDLEGPYNVFRNIEMPVMKVCCDMEDRGICLDFDIANNLIEKYHKIKDERQKQAQEALAMYDDLVDTYRMEHPNNKLSDPISLSSPTQLAILFYDILKLESPNKTSPRGTGEDILKHFAKGREKNLCEAILGIREVDKLLSTYIDKMPEIVHTDGRIHCNYNQYGAKTGRFSSSDPNMQNIPSHNKEIRTMFKAQDGYVLIGGDYSQQEPMVTAYLSDDKTMQDAFIHGKDIYATIAGLAFGKPYEECLEFRKDGTVNPAGKERRTQAKSIVLGILYGRQIPSIGEQLGVSTKEAQKIYDKVMASFPALANFIDESQDMARTKGYVTTAWGRRRHLPDMQLEPYEFSLDGGNPIGFDPLAFGQEISNEVPSSIKREYTRKLNGAFGWQKKSQILEEARSRGIKIKDNGGFIAQAERQCVNARVQGSAADMAKLAMIKINNDARMKELDFHLIIQVHDEVIGECPRENAKECAERLSLLMREAPADLIKLPFKCDCEVTTNWYGEEIKF